MWLILKNIIHYKSLKKQLKGRKIINSGFTYPSKCIFPSLNSFNPDQSGDENKIAENLQSSKDESITLFTWDAAKDTLLGIFIVQTLTK